MHDGRTLKSYKMCSEGAVVTVTRMTGNPLDDEDDAPLVNAAEVYTSDFIRDSTVTLTPSQCSELLVVT